MTLEEAIERHEVACEAFEARTGLKEGAHIRYIGGTDAQIRGYGPSYSDPRGILDFETIYEIECMTIGRSWSIVQ